MTIAGMDGVNVMAAVRKRPPWKPAGSKCEQFCGRSSQRVQFSSSGPRVRVVLAGVTGAMPTAVSGARFESLQVLSSVPGGEMQTQKYGLCERVGGGQTHKWS